MQYRSQFTDKVLMVRPHHFIANPETAADNHFQQLPGDTRSDAQGAYKEVSNAVEKLSHLGITVHLFEDTSTATPDSVFPNNWFSTHANGTLFTYPMYVQNRRAERRPDILELLNDRYQVKQSIDLSRHELNDSFLEGTGSMVLDHTNGIAYAARSKRTHAHLLREFCQTMGYKPVMFDAVDSDGVPIYHTNVMMSVTSHFAIVALDCIPDPSQRQRLQKMFAATGKTTVNLSQHQIAQFCGNVLELGDKERQYLVCSETAFLAFTEAQKQLIEKQLQLVPIAVPTIEKAGGSIRCMLAGIHLPTK